MLNETFDNFLFYLKFDKSKINRIEYFEYFAHLFILLDTQNTSTPYITQL